MVVPEGFAIPAIPYVLALLAGAVVISGGLLRVDPPVTSWTVLAFAPWMGIGGGLHVLSIIGIVPDTVAPLLGTPAVYVTTSILGGAVWLGATAAGSIHVPRLLGGIGVAGLLLVVGIVVWTGVSRGTLSPAWPVAGLFLSIGIAGGIWFALRRMASPVVTVTSWTGLVVIFGHVLDGISTAIGIDILNAGERSPLPRAIMGFAGQLPTADFIGVGWLFLLVKLIIAVAIVWVFIPFVRETPRQGHLVLGVLAAVGLGPGVHNLLLFMVIG